ncbi:MAG TPA: hypothetical protein VIP11_25735, partial [Gemmatimonadaceae bacterium]
NDTTRLRRLQCLNRISPSHRKATTFYALGIATDKDETSLIFVTPHSPTSATPVGVHHRVEPRLGCTTNTSCPQGFFSDR